MCIIDGEDAVVMEYRAAKKAAKLEGPNPTLFTILELWPWGQKVVRLDGTRS